MSYYCTNCQVNWATLHTRDVQDETYEYCPVCRTDLTLEETKRGPSFICSPFSGRITNVATGEELIRNEKPLIKDKRTRKRLTDVQKEALRELRLQVENEAIDAYQETHSVQGQVAAETAYRTMLATYDERSKVIIIEQIPA